MNQYPQQYQAYYYPAQYQPLFWTAVLEGLIGVTVLVAMGAEYTAREYTYKYVHATRTIRLLTVRGCPRWAEGSVAG